MVGFLPQLNWINQIQIPDYQKELQPGWDGYGGRVPTDEAMHTARCMSLVPGGDGSLQFEIHAGGMSVEICISPDGKITDVFSEATKPRVAVEGVASDSTSRKLS